MPRSGALSFLLRFGVASLLGAAVLRLAAQRLGFPNAGTALFLTASCAAMLSARGIGWSRKAGFTAVTCTGFFGLRGFFAVLGVGPGAGVADRYPLGVALAALNHAALLALPLALLVVFVGGDPSQLWQDRADDSAT